MPAANRSMSAQHAAPKSTSNSEAVKSNKTMQKHSASSARQPATPSQQPLLEESDSAQALREDLLDLKAAIQSETLDNETQMSSSDQTEGRKDQDTA